MNVVDNYESVVYVCLIIFEFLDVILKDDMVVFLYFSFFVNCGSIIIVLDCMNVYLKVIGMVNESEDYSNISDGSSDNKNEIKIEVMDECNMIMVKSNEMVICLVFLEEKFVVK